MERTIKKRPDGKFDVVEATRKEVLVTHNGLLGFRKMMIAEITTAEERIVSTKKEIALVNVALGFAGDDLAEKEFDQKEIEEARKKAEELKLKEGKAEVKPKG